MIEVRINYRGPIDKMKERQLAEAIRRTVKYLAESEYIKFVTVVDVKVVDAEVLP